MTGTAPLGPGPLLVDAHVHIYPRFDRAAFLDAAAANVRRAAAARGLDPDTPGWLLLTETAADHAFAELAEQAATETGPGGWRLRPTGDPLCLLAHRDGQAPLGLLAGRQIVTEGGLEVLALGTGATFPDGGTLADALARVAAAGALAVLPWGFGKWLGARGARVRAAVARAAPGTLFLGDNGGRAGPRPRLLAEAEAAGRVVLPGSDPLPLPGQETRAGGFGFVLDAALDPDRPGASLKARLAALATSPPVYGRTTGALPFAGNQIRMQLRKHGISP
ncbi:hypothetical protein [uncultured Jannaschia sp.]|uniref:hypothetical protein n=1 Tax=uncultured Jannaschia sp. TaxID=293347 RepID=UPI00262670EE|nr:hypothetical protein [uncultured Jannaschia sp.]